MLTAGDMAFTGVNPDDLGVVAFRAYRHSAHCLKREE